MKKIWRKMLVVLLAATHLPAAAQTVISYERIAGQSDATRFGAHLGVAAGDFDQDGDDDLYISSQNTSNLLYENLGDGRFKEVTEAAGVGTTGSGFSAVWGDIDNDGDLDLYVATWSKGNHLFVNQGDGTFRDATQQAGLELKANAVHAMMADVDNDGYLDLYLTINDDGNRLYRNNADGTFSDATVESRTGYVGRAMGAGFFDYDKDGDVDLYLVHDFRQANNLFQNDGSGRFVDVAARAGVDFAGDGMGADFGDYDNDGWLDIYITNMNDNLLFRNNGDGTFTNVTAAAGVSAGGMSWGCHFLDYDNDGWLDIFVANQSHFWQMQQIFPNALYRNRGDGTFVEVAAQAGLATTFDSFGCARLDFDNDGWPDIVVADNAAGSGDEFLRNLGGPNHWLQVRLHGVQSNRSAIGARVEAFAGKWHRVEQVRAGSGYNSQNSLALAFGLGDHDKVDSLAIYWPSGRVEKYVGLAADRRLEFIESRGAITSAGAAADAARPPRDFAVLTNYPNPFNPATAIQFHLARPARAALSIYDTGGRLVATLLDQPMAAGPHRFIWRGVDAAGRPLAAGVYMARLAIGGSRVYVQKMLLLR